MQFLTASVLLSIVPALVASSGIGHQHKRAADTYTSWQTQVDVETVNAYVTLTVVDGDDVSSTAAEASTSAAPTSETTTVAPTVASALQENEVVASSLSAAATTSSSSAAAEASSTYSSVEPASSSVSSTYSSVEPASSSTSSTSSSTSSGSSGNSGWTAYNSRAVGDAGALGITYSPYTSSGNCKTASQVKSDFSNLSGYKIIRLYDVDCSGVENVLAAMNDDQTLFAGIFHLTNIANDVETLHKAIKSAGKGWDVVDTVSVGNELVNSGSASTSQIQSALSTAKSALQSAGYTGPVVSVDTLVAVENNKDLCEYSDYIAVNSHPYFGDVEAADSGSWLLEQIENVYNVCGSVKSVTITETGWPHSGEANGKSVPSIANQEAAVAAIKKHTGASVLLFTVYNDYWKQAGQYNVDQSWGLYGDSPA